MSKGPYSTKVDVFGFRLHLATTRAELKKLRRDFPGDALEDAHSNAGTTTMVIELLPTGSTRSHILVWVDAAAHKKTASLVNTLAHEASHVHDFVAEYLQLETGDETQAYLIGWVTQWMWERASV